jgi:hypothetical protein
VCDARARTRPSGFRALEGQAARRTSIRGADRKAKPATAARGPLPGRPRRRRRWCWCLLGIHETDRPDQVGMQVHHGAAARAAGASITTWLPPARA